MNSPSTAPGDLSDKLPAIIVGVGELTEVREVEGGKGENVLLVLLWIREVRRQKNSIRESWAWGDGH